MKPLSRRALLKGGIACAAPALVSGASPYNPQKEAMLDTPAKAVQKNRIHQSVSRWCYQNIPLDELCAAAAAMGLKGIDLLSPDEYEIPRRYGLICTMGYAGGGEIAKGLNRIENHASIEASMREYVPLAAKAGVPNVITFSGLRDGMTDEAGARNTMIGLRRLRNILEDHGVNLCLELLNSKLDHPGYMCDRTAWGARVIEEVSSPNIKLLYDIYHMQIMEGDLIATINSHIKSIGHFHTGGVPGRHDLDDSQEINWIGVMRAIAATGYSGYVAHEFLPLADPLAALRHAVKLCDI